MLRKYKTLVNFELITAKKLTQRVFKTNKNVIASNRDEQDDIKDPKGF